MELQHLTRLGKRIGLSLIFFLAIPANLVKAQVVPDGTLESTVETIQELMKIDGGLTEGSNLFHSFEEFSIPEGMEASFENAIEIENIFTRVTGDSASTINGTLSAQGGANLFLMNPNGIVFGQDASINIGGSFIATTADSIQFQDSTEFAATGTKDQTPLLTNEIPIGLGFGSQNSGNITVNGEGNEVTIDSPISPTIVESEGLEVESGNTLALIGNDITIDGGSVNAPEGNLSIGSVGFGEVGIQPTDSGFNFDYSNVNVYSDIALTNQAALTSSGQGGGAITIWGENVSLENGSTTIIANQGADDSGDININATETFTLLGKDEDGTTSSSVRAQALDSGAGGNVNISTANLVLQDASTITGITFADGQGGNVNIDVSNSIELQEDTINNPNNTSSSSPVSTIVSTTYGSGNAGNLQLSTPRLQIVDGNSIGSPTVGSGDGGNVNIKADSIDLIGTKELEAVPSSIFASSVNTGNAGNIEVNTSSLRISDGANINSSSIANGDAGNVTVNASSTIEVAASNQSSTEPQPSNISSSVTIPNEFLQQAFSLDSQPSGNAGNVVVNTPSLFIDRGGIVSVGNQGIGNSGTLSINANEVNLNNSSSINATSRSGQGGNIQLQVGELDIDDGSQITAEAEGDSGGGNININATNITAKKNSDISANAEGGNGGNITIDAETLLGLNNSDITANAVEGNGGNINITATSILGFEERPELTPMSDITASSEFGVDGTVTINSPETNAEEDVQVSAKKPEAPLTPLEFVKGCQLPEGILTTRGRGVPESPYPFPFGYLSHDESDGDIYQKAKETMRQERQKQQREERENGISLQERKRRNEARELAMLREKQRLLPNRHEHLMYEVTDDREVGSMLLPAPKGKLVEPADGRTDKNAIPAFYSESNELPPISREKRLRQEGNVLVINPDGSQHFVRMFLMSHPSEEICETTVGLK